MPEETDNPFTPFAGESPPLRVGREEAIGELSEMKQSLLAKGRGRTVVLYGPLGCGVTTMLAEIRDWARAEEVEVRARTGDQLGDSLAAAWSLREDSNVRSGLSQEDIFANLAGTLMKIASRRPAVVLVDDAQLLDTKVGAELLTATHKCGGESLPVLTILAGTPQLLTTLRGTGVSYSGRLGILPVGPLESEGDVGKALSAPSAQSGLPVEEDALALLVAESKRYPLHVQRLGWEAWAVAQREGHASITLQDAEEGLGKADRELKRLCQERLDEVRELNVLPAAVAVSTAMTADEDGRLINDKDMGNLLLPFAEDSGSTIGRILEQLVQVGLIWRGGSLHWEPAIPSLCEFMAGFLD